MQLTKIRLAAMLEFCMHASMIGKIEFPSMQHYINQNEKKINKK